MFQGWRSFKWRQLVYYCTWEPTLRAESLLSLAATVSGELNAEDVLNGIVRGLAAEPGVALARVWLLKPGDICARCVMRPKCLDQTQCLHLAASAGTPIKTVDENWSALTHPYSRIPLANKREGRIATEGTSILTEEFLDASQGTAKPDWAREEQLQSFVGHPLISRGKTLGVLSVFSRGNLTDQDSAWLQIFAHQVSVAITNAQAFEELQRAQAWQEEHARELKQVLDVVPMHMFIWEADARVSYGNRASLDYFGPIPLMEPMEFLDLVTHPEEAGQLKEGIRQAIKNGESFEMEARMRRHDGEYRWFLYQLRALRDEKGRIIRWCGTRVDIEDRKRAADRAHKEYLELRDHLNELQQIMDILPQHMYIIQPDGASVQSNRSVYDYFGPFGQLAPGGFLEKFAHPDDAERVWEEFQEAAQTARAFHTEIRLKGVQGQYRWFLDHLVPLRDAQGNVLRWCGVRTDIDEQKQIQERTNRENLALREEIDKVSMFEEIVGASAALEAALRRVARVAKTNSTVLITGETGTGKELIARAIHKRSLRADRPFIGVNCAAIPRDLIPSELFGHEKGAFTGALQKRIGRFELADGGTIFLDEVGELPMETQIALLRVLQEREFERVGGSQTIRVDTRIIAATNRDLPAAVAAGTFRSDLLYRINVFPIQVPSLRERKEDIRLLVEYFVDRFSSNMGKKISRIDKKSLAQLEAYPWPGNIRELQNVVERSVIVCDADEFYVDDSWLSHQAQPGRPLQDDMVTQEKERIEAALAETKGRVSGPSGAAARLGIPASTLDSKIKSLKINKRSFQTA
jgi:PAS domain S-box-containing protein